jgi:hypothetical protein
MSVPLKLNAEQAIAAIQQHMGNVTMAARACGVSRQTFYDFMAKHATVKRALDEARETMIDNVESRLYSKALAGEGWAVCFFLKTQGHKRGYVEHHEISGPDGGPIRVIMDS